MRTPCLLSLALSAVLLCACGRTGSLVVKHARFLSEPNGYVCSFADVPPVIDGKLDDAVWQKAEADFRFTDISGEGFPEPRFKTSVKLLWDSTFLYVGAEMEEPHVSSCISARDDIVYHDNDFEVFLDPDGDARNYFELEVNALGNLFDLFLAGSYRDPDRPFISFGWDCPGLQLATCVDGTLNDPSDTDRGWSAEFAIPARAVLTEWDSSFTEGMLMRVGFSRVEWQWDIRDGVYTRKEREDGTLLPEDNWTWGPTGMVAMHMPERWGRVYLAREGYEGGVPAAYPTDRLLWAMFYEQEAAFAKTGRYLKAIPLGPEDKALLPAGKGPEIETASDRYRIGIPMGDGRMRCIDSSGKIFTK